MPGSKAQRETLTERLSPPGVALVGADPSCKTAGNYDTRLAGSVPGGVDPNGQIYRYLDTSGDSNYSGYSNPHMDYVLANSLEAVDPKARAVNYRVAQQIIHDDRPMIILYNPITLAAYNTSLTGVGLTATSIIDIAHARFT